MNSQNNWSNIFEIIVVIGAGIFAWQATNSILEADFESAEKGFYESIFADVFGKAECVEGPISRAASHDAALDDVDSNATSDQNNVEEDEGDEDINLRVSKKRMLTSKDTAYIIDLLEKQAFSQELLMKQLSEGVPEWANDLVAANRDLLKDLRAAKRGFDGQKEPASKPRQSLPVCDFISSDSNPDFRLESSHEILRTALGAVVEIFGTDDGTGCRTSENNDSLKNGCGMIIMYLNNILKNPSMPRYISCVLKSSKFTSLFTIRSTIVKGTEKF